MTRAKETVVPVKASFYCRLVAQSFLLLAVSFVCSPPAHADKRFLVTQSSGSDCGPAALATLLTYYFDIPSGEAEIAALSHANQFGTTLLGLEQATQAKGGGAQSFRMDFPTLHRQLDSYPAPVLVRLLLPEPHFVLVLGIDENSVMLSDPASGNVAMPHKAFLWRWLIPQAKSTYKEKNKQQVEEGYVLIAARPDGKTSKSHLDEVLREMRLQKRILKTQKTAPVMRR
jgi:predicted double-glycine peptidase